MADETESPVRMPEINRNRAPVGILTVITLYAVFAALWILLSDKALEWYLTDPAQFALISTFKVWAFVVVTSLLLYGLMRRILVFPTSPTSPMPGLRPLLLPIGLLSLAIVILTIGGIAHTVIHQQDILLFNAHNQLLWSFGIRTDIPIILCTGAARAVSKDQIEQTGVSAVLKKPVLRRDVASAIRQVLDSNGMTGS